MDVRQFSGDKILAHLDRVWEWLENRVSRPITYELDVTNLCNNRCPYCFGFLGRENHSESLELEEGKSIIKQIKDFGGRGLTFTGGGEPLCNPVTPELVPYAREIGLDVGFITNGFSLNRPVARVLLANCVWVRVSLDAASPEVYRLTHGMNEEAYEKVLENVRMAVFAKAEMKSSCSLGLGYLTPPVKKDEIRKFALLGGKLGVDYVQFRPLLRRYAEKEPDYDSEETIEEVERCTGLSRPGYQVLYSKHKYDDLRKGQVCRPYKKCYGHHFAAVIAADRKMYLCCHMRGVDKYCLGDLSGSTLREIWFSQRRKEVYENIDFGDCPYLCRCNTFNAVLWNIREEKVHRNFL